MKFNSKWCRMAAVLVLGAGGLAAYQAPAVRAAIGPTVVVTVDLSRVLNGLKQRADSEASLKTFAERVLAEDGQRQNELKELQKQIDDLAKRGVAFEDPERRTLEETAAQTSLRYNVWTRFQTDKLDIERHLLLQDLYRTIKKEVAAMAAANGYHIVLVDDSQGELIVDPEMRLSRETQVRQQIQARRMLYADPAVDITDALVTRMNNAWNAGPGMGKPGAP